MRRLFRVREGTGRRSGSIVAIEPHLRPGFLTGVPIVEEARTSLEAPATTVHALLTLGWRHYNQDVWFRACYSDLEPLSDEETAVVEVMLS